MPQRPTLAKSYWTLPLMVLLLLVVAILSLHVGAHPISLWQLSEILSDPTSVEYTILMQLRLPRIINAISIGGGLSLCGAILQGLFRNPLVEPYTLGISGGASLGVTLAIVLGLSTAFLTLPAFGFIGALVTILLVYANSYQRHGLSVQRMLLVGVMVSFMASSGVMLLLSVARAEQLSRIIFWTMGSLQESIPLIVWGMLLFTLLLLGVSYLFVQSLNALRLGELKAQQLGIDTRRVVLWLFVLSSLLTSACVAVAGVIGFVGLVIPQATRILLGNDYRVLLVGSFINGGIFLILCDMLARTILSPIELPIGVITGLIGGVAFLYLIHRTRRSHQI